LHNNNKLEKLYQKTNKYDCIFYLISVMTQIHGKC
jgi:hypothetical protein